MTGSPMRLVLGFAALLTAGSRATAQQPTPQPASGCCTATIRVTVPEGTGTVYLAGSLPDLGPWRPDGRAMTGAGRERIARVTAPRGTTFEYKFTLGAWEREALGPAGGVPPNHRLLIDRDVDAGHDVVGFKKDLREYVADWRGSGVLGRLVYWMDVGSAFFLPARPPGGWLS